MQLSLEKSSNPIVEAAEPSSPRRVDPTVDTSLGRTRYPSPFLQMLSDLSDSPARPGGPSDGTIGVVDPHPNPVGGATTTATSDGHPTQASVLVDATMDGRDPPVVRGHLTRFYPSAANTSAVVAPIPANLVEPTERPGMSPEYRVALVGPVVGIFVHWYPLNALPREPHPLLFTRWSTALQFYGQMYTARQVFLHGNSTSTAAPVVPLLIETPVAPLPVATPVAPLPVPGTSSTTSFNRFPPIRPPRTPTGNSDNPIFVTSASPKKRVHKATARTQIVKGKAKRTKIVVDTCSSPASVPQHEDSMVLAPSSTRWPVVVLTDSEEETAVAVASVPALAPATIPTADASVGRPSSPDQEAPRTPLLVSRRRRAPRTGTRAPRGRAKRNVSPRYASPPSDMYLSDSPPKNPPPPTAVTAPISTQPSTVVDMYDDMYDSDSSQELPLSIIPRAAQAATQLVLPMTDSGVDLDNEPASSQNPFGAPSFTRATRGLSSPVAPLSQSANIFSITPSTSRLFSPANDQTHTPLHFPSSPPPSRAYRGFSPSGAAYTTGPMSHRHLDNDEFDFFIEQALSNPSHR